MSRPLLLDLFCGQGGAAMGYHRAGFDVIGVDIVPRPRYPFPFVLADALLPPFDLARFDAIHASPPCQAYSSSTPSRTRGDHPMLVDATREMLTEAGRPAVIENVPGSPVHGDFMLCGTMFGLRSASGLHVQRHRYFETVGWIPDALGPQCAHKPGRTMTIAGNGTASGNKLTLGRNVSVDEWREGMGMPWATRYGISQAIPPAYSEFIGAQLLEALR